MDKEKNVRAIKMFLIIVFSAAWITVLASYLCGLRYGNDTFSAVMTVMMFYPAAASLITRKANGEGFESIRIKPRFKGHIFQYLLIWFLPAIAIICGAMLYFTVNPSALDPGMSAMVQGMKDNMQKAGETITDEAALNTIYVNILVMGLCAPLANIMTALGETLGFHGFLLQKLCNIFRPAQAVIIDGLIWGIWYLPMVIIGYPYGFTYTGYPVTGILLMILFCEAFGIILSYFTLNIGSVLPAAFGKSAFATLFGIPLYFISQDSTVSAGELLTVGPVPTGILSMIVFILLGLIYILKSNRLEWNPEKEAVKANGIKRKSLAQIFRRK
jgi:hypothetical protein